MNIFLNPSKCLHIILLCGNNKTLFDCNIKSSIIKTLKSKSVFHLPMFLFIFFFTEILNLLLITNQILKIIVREIRPEKVKT